MARGIIVLLIAGIFANSSFGQNVKADTLVELTYYPAFHNPAQLKLFRENGTPMAVLLTLSTKEKSDKLDTVIKTLPIDVYERYTNFFQAYHFPGFIDNKYPETTKNYERGYDGITIVGVYFKDTSERLFRFWSPYRDTKSLELLKMTFKDMEEYLRTDDNKKYLKWLKMYAK